MYIPVVCILARFLTKFSMTALKHVSGSIRLAAAAELEGRVYSTVIRDACVPLAANIANRGTALFSSGNANKVVRCVSEQIAGFHVVATSNICRRNRRNKSYLT